MARKLYVFGIGGTGSRVIKSLVMLFAAGVKLDNDFDTVVPILIDPDTENGDLNRTKDILRLYQEIRNQIKDPDDFYKQDLKTVNELANPIHKTINPDYFQFKLNDVDSKTFGQYIGFDSYSDDYKGAKDDKSFVKLLFSNSNLNSDLSIGFKGNPNMGSVVLNQFTNSEDFKKFGQTFGPEDAIFIVNSIFGGTGAAGFPLLLKNLRGNSDILNSAYIKIAPIGGITYLPYFTLDKREEVDADSFEEKAKIALDYYNRTIIIQNKINVLHYIGNKGNTNAEGYAVGGAEQRNKAHFLEIAGAIAVIEFCKNINQYLFRDGQMTRPTEIREFGIERANDILSFDDLKIDHKELLYKPLVKFKLFTEYLSQGLNKALDYSRWTKSKFFVFNDQKKSPCDYDYFKSSEYKNQVAAYNRHFKDWINELSHNKPAFNPFFDVVPSELFKKIDTQNCFNIDNLKLRSGKSNKTGKPSEYHTTLIKLFEISTEKTFKKLSIRENSDIEKKIKVFRLHEGQDGTGWFVSAAIDKLALKSIRTEGKQIASSIPSPFARIDLVKSAFDWINFQVSEIVGKYAQGMQISPEDRLRIKDIFEEKTAQNRLISDSLDIAQLFYKYPAIKKKVEIVSWDLNSRLKVLIENGSINFRHSIFAETLRIFWDQDSVRGLDQARVPALYNFEHVQRLFFVINKNSKQVIGGTSPATLFFAAPDSREAIRELNIVFGNDRLLDDIYSPLHKREVHFIEYLYALAKQDNMFPQHFPEVHTYLENVKMYLLDQSIRTVVSNLNSNSIDRYDRCHVLHDEKDYCEILGMKLGTEKSLLEDKLIELPYYVDTTKFKTCGAKKHLLPVTQAFIEKYGVDKIEQYCTMEERAGGGMEVTLSIPVQNGTIQHKKLYHRDDIVRIDFHLAIAPFVRTTSIDLDYTLGILDKRFNRENEISIKCYNSTGSIINTTDLITRKSGKGNTIKSTYTKTKVFEAINIECGLYRGFIIPCFYNSQANSQVSFAIDFGTTNTHIEYRRGSEAEKAIDIYGDSPLWQSLIDRSSGDTKQIAEDNYFEMEILPYIFSNLTDYKFPFRTAITYNKDIDFNREINVFTHTNNFLLFEKLSPPLHLELQPKLKWSNYNENKDKALVNSYIECLLYIVFYKTLLIDGNPKEVLITWFYPVSMDSYEQGIFMEAWQKSYMRIFKVDNIRNLTAIPESIAPYLYYRGTQYAGTCLSMDIGGGSSDIAFFENSNDLPEFISSVKFAGNAIFGDGFPMGPFSNSSDNNGFVNAYKEKIERTIPTGSQKQNILTDILVTRKDSADFSNFLFSLENERDVNFNYTQELRAHRRLKLPILVFYSALLYYASKIIKQQNGKIPKNILFSGTAAKTLKIIDAQRNFPNVSNLFRHIISKVTGMSVDQLKIALSENPKEITCKGALKAGLRETLYNCPTLFWLGGTENSNLGQVLSSKTKMVETPLYSDLENEKNKKLIEESINSFFDLLDKYVRTINLESEYGIDYSAYEVFMNIRSRNVQDFIDQGIKAFYKLPAKHIEETLFFYPLIGILHTLSLELSNSDNL
jgi:hypothetical protein